MLICACSWGTIPLVAIVCWPLVTPVEGTGEGAGTGTGAGVLGGTVLTLVGCEVEVVPGWADCCRGAPVIRLKRSCCCAVTPLVMPHFIARYVKNGSRS